LTAPLLVRPGLVIPASELSWRAVRASGAGGQNVNKVASKVELRFALSASATLDAGSKARLAARARLDAGGALIVVSQKTRDQSRNLADARERLRSMILAALVPPKPRHATRPSRGAKARRLAEKAHRAKTKKLRQRDFD
jgi:ribosome-associated protein